MANYIVDLVKIGSIAGMYYRVPKRRVSSIIVYGLGAPLAPDSGYLPDAPFILGHQCDILVVDYTGYGRSDGRFTPLNCIKTFLKLYNELTGGTQAISNYKNTKYPMQYPQIMFVGRSFGGAYVPLLPKFNKKIKNICMLYPVVDYTRVGKMKKEETMEGFLAAMRFDGYRHLYRGILSEKWQKHFQSLDGLAPIDNIDSLEEAKVFIGHGKKDININYTNSVNYYNKLIKKFPHKKEQFLLKLYPGDHSPKTSNPAILDYLSWMQVPKAI